MLRSHPSEDIKLVVKYESLEVRGEVLAGDISLGVFSINGKSSCGKDEIT